MANSPSDELPFSSRHGARVLTRAERIACGIRAIPPKGCPPVGCSKCGTPTDPLRAPRVQVNEKRFHYFCSADCDAAFTPGTVVASFAPQELEVDIVDFIPEAAESEDSCSPEPSSDATLPVSDSATQHRPVPLTREPLLLGAASLFGLASISTAGLSHTDRVLWVGFGAIASSILLVTSAVSSPSPHKQGPIQALLGHALAPVLAALATTYGLLLDSPDAFHLALGTGLLSLLASLCRLGGFAETRRIVGLRTLGLPDMEQRTEGDADADAEKVLTESPHTTGDVLTLVGPCHLEDDATILSGQAQVRAWPGATHAVAKGTGDTLYSGARIEQGSLEVVIRWTRQDRSHLRLLCPDTQLVRQQTHSLRNAIRMSRQGALAAAIACAISALVAARSPEMIVFYFATGFAMLRNCELPRWVQLLLTRRIYQFVQAGVFFREAAGLDQAGRAPSAVLCALSSMLHNAPQVGNIEPLMPSVSNNELLGIAASGYAHSHSSIGKALEKATRAAKLNVVPSRSPQHRAGLGTVAVTAEGKAVVVGTRALLLSQRISVAAAEPRILHYEKLGRSVLLVAVAGRLMGILALQDQLRRGARGAVQYLLQAGIEPILLSGDSRETCQALARTTGISHVRPEVLPQARAEAIVTLAASRNPMLVVGKSGMDSHALEASDFAINLEGRGAPLERWDVEVASGSIRDATKALADCKQLRLASQRLLLLQWLPLGVGLLWMILGGPLWLAALAAPLGTVLAWGSLRKDIA